MRVFRISQSKFINDISGTGAWLTGGRWNSQNKYMLYTSESLALAALETLVNIRPQRIDFKMPRMFATISIPENTSVKSIEIQDLPQDWSSDSSPDFLKLLGNDWLDSLETLVLKVPSAVIPSESNFLINPKHPDFHLVKIEAVQTFQFDPRLFKSKL